MKAFGQLYLANLREFRRDVTALFWTFAFPFFFIVIFGVIFSGNGDISFDLGVVNQDGANSTPMVEGFRAIDAFDVTTGELDEELDALEAGDRSVVIVIPEGTGAQMGAYITQVHDASADAPLPQVPIEVYYDPADQNTAQIALNIVDTVIAGMNEGMTGISPAITLQPKEVTQNSLRNIDYLLPGVLAMSLMQAGLFGTAGPLVSLREKGILRRMGATPLSRQALLASQVAFRLTTAFFQTALILAAGSLLFNVHLELASLPATIGVVLLGASMFILLGYFLSGLAKTQEAVESIVQLPNFVFMFLSGIFFPVEMMPDWTRPLVDAIPLTYLGDALRKTMIDAGSYYSMTRNLSILLIWLVVCAILAVRFFRWEPQA